MRSTSHNDLRRNDGVLGMEKKQIARVVTNFKNHSNHFNHLNASAANIP